MKREKIGRGTLKILDTCKQAGIKSPVWEIGKQTVKLTFFSDVKLGGATKGANEGAIEGVTKGVKDKLAILLSAIAANEGNRVPEYKEATGLPDSSMERYIKQLRDGGLLEFKGEAAHTGGYYLTKKMKAKLKKLKSKEVQAVTAKH